MCLTLEVIQLKEPWGFWRTQWFCDSSRYRSVQDLGGYCPQRSKETCFYGLWSRHSRCWSQRYSFGMSLRHQVLSHSKATAPHWLGNQLNYKCDYIMLKRICRQEEVDYLWIASIELPDIEALASSISQCLVAVPCKARHALIVVSWKTEDLARTNYTFLSSLCGKLTLEIRPKVHAVASVILKTANHFHPEGVPAVE